LSSAAATPEPWQPTVYSRTLASTITLVNARPKFVQRLRLHQFVAGIETAAELAERGHLVTLVCGGRLAPSFSEPARRSVARWLARNGVVLLEADVVTEVRPDAVVFADGAVRPSAVTVWTAGFGVPELAARSGLRTDPLGRLLTDETLTSVDDDRIVGVRAARFGLAYVGSNVGLGRRAARFQFTRMDDTPVNVYFGGRIGGRIAASVKEAVAKGTLWGIRREARKPGSTRWPKGGPRPEQPMLEPEAATNP
jgi:NADH dehydrogenase